MDAMEDTTMVEAPPVAESETAATIIARQAAAWDIARRRRIQATLLSDGSWRAQTQTGEVIGTGSYADPIEALEAAEAMFAAAEARVAEASCRSLFDALQMGVYVPWPRSGKDGNVEWVVMRAADETVIGDPFDGLTAALVEIKRLVG